MDGNVRAWRNLTMLMQRWAGPIPQPKEPDDAV